MTFQISKKLLVLTALLGTSLAAIAAPPTSGAYITDPQEQYVKDISLEAIESASSIICYVDKVRADAMVNRGRYTALVDANACDNAAQSATSSTNTSATASSVVYDTHSVTSTRADNNSPQFIKGHIQANQDDGGVIAIYTNGQATSGPTSSLPNGLFSLDFSVFMADDSNRQTGDKVHRGTIAAISSGVTLSEKSSDGESVQLFLNGTNSSGLGAIKVNAQDYSQNPVRFVENNFIYGYNATHFCRKEAREANEQCFDRSADNAIKSVWRYGVYTSAGAQFDVPSPSFNIKDANGGYGHASYWGVWSNAAQTDGMKFTNEKTPSIIYTLKKSGGKLLKHTKNKTTLNAVENNIFQFYGQSTVNTLSGGYSYEASWNGSNFIVRKKINCDNNGCFMQTLTSEVTLSPSQLNAATNSNGVWGWSQTLGGSFNIPSATLLNGTPGTLADGVSYETQVTVLPGDTSVPTSLICVNNCPTNSLIDSAIRSTDTNTSPFTLGTKDKWGGTLVSDTVQYEWNAQNYTLENGGTVIAYPSGVVNLNSRYQWGINSGTLVALADAGELTCGSARCDYKARSLPVFYTFETGEQDWNRPGFLKKDSDNTYVTFTRPLDARYNVPDEAAYGEYRGATMNLQFNGFGDLNGIPGQCISRATNEVVSCGPGTDWVAAFTIPTGATVNIAGTDYFVKWLNRGVSFQKVASNAATLQITMGAIASIPEPALLTGADAADPSNASNTAIYPGAYNSVDFTTPPAVIQGVVQ
jgi:hypothetical protein